MFFCLISPARTGGWRQLIHSGIYVFGMGSFDTQLCPGKQLGECGCEPGTDCLCGVCLGGCTPAFIPPWLCDTHLSPLARAIPVCHRLCSPGLGQMSHCPHSQGQGCTSPAPLAMPEAGDVFLNYPGKVCIFLRAKIKKDFHYLLSIKKKKKPFWMHF